MTDVSIQINEYENNESENNEFEINESTPLIPIDAPLHPHQPSIDDVKELSHSSQNRDKKISAAPPMSITERMCMCLQISMCTIIVIGIADLAIGWIFMILYGLNGFLAWVIPVGISFIAGCVIMGITTRSHRYSSHENPTTLNESNSSEKISDSSDV